MSDKLVYSFPSEARPTLSEVGGKGLSLIDGTVAGLPIPPGFVLTVRFFESWLTELKSGDAWKKFLEASNAELEKASAALKDAAAGFSLNNEQKSILEDALRQMHNSKLFAVRSSSPHEDLEGASFAGGYETVLGVTRDTLHQAIKRCFASVLDYRVFVYMRESGFDATDPKIAVIVQEQIGSEISGVGFSLNPLTNNYDEAIFNANWGLGETVVAGDVTPDSFTVDKVNEKVIATTIGSKEISVWLTATGGTEKRPHYKSADTTLSTGQVITLTKLIKKVENIYAMPIDIEWAFAAGQPFLLQARPITAYVPLTPDMITPPGGKKRLYFDISITAEGMTRPISYLGTSAFRRLLRGVGKLIFLRDINRNIDTAIARAMDGRLYVNLSTFFKLIGKKGFADVFLRNIDPLAMRTVQALDEDTYMPAVSRLRLLPYGLIFLFPFIFFHILRAKRDPETMHQRLQDRFERFEKKARAIVAKDMPIERMVDILIPKMFREVFARMIPLVIMSRLALGRMERAAGEHPDRDKLTRSIPHNITIEMSLALATVAEHAPSGMRAQEIYERLVRGELPQEFMERWKRFIERFGMRGPEEIDLSAPRYSDDPKMLLELVVAMKENSGESPQASFERGEREREAAFQAIRTQIEAKDPKAAERFTRDYEFFVNFGGYRETHKYYLVFWGALIREKILARAREFVVAGRLDSAEHVFDLSLDQLDRALADASLDLRALARSNTAFLRKLARVKRPPTLIDSRGLIPRAPQPPTQDGAAVGVAISSGVVRGRIKTLRTPHEKPFNKGEILVARATDPGWTPLFLNAAGVILEVGGVLQHGALVAREYGLPCVAGIDNATELWKDGDLVEVDGTSGIVRKIKE